ncbi:minor tail protein [Arthrobacter phage Edmundo]|nr:minor tail protein [Arthrobacter phage Edmundo]
MTLIQVRVHRPSDTGTIPAGGQLEWTPTAATSLPTSPVTVVLPAPFTVNLTDDINEFTAIETGPTWAWRVVETFPGQPQQTRYVLVTGEGPVDYTTLPSVDPATLEPAAQPDVPVWYAYVDALEAEAARSADAADLAKAAALAAQASATGSADAASQSASNAAARAVEAGTSAFNAGSSAATAAGHVTTAQQAASNAAASVVTAAGHATNAGTAASAASTAAGVASGHATAAAGSATAASGSASASQTARLGAEAARDRAELVATAFKIGDVTTSAPGAPASAVIHGEGPFRELDLTIPRGVQGPPLVGVVLDTVTGPETPGATGMQGAKGDKGDPGGFTFGTLLDATHLDTVIVPGLYRQTTGSNCTTANGYPITTNATANVMVLGVATGHVEQRVEFTISTHASRVQFHRATTNSGTTWGTWRSFTSSRVDNTAGRAVYQWDETNGRDQLIWGDTGSRDITSTHLDSTKWDGGQLKIRRVGSEVELRGLALNNNAAAVGDVTILTAQLPSGFRNQHTVTGAANSSTGLQRAVLAFTATQLTVGGVTSGYNSDFTLKWQTSDPWPSALPGVADGTIQYL